MLPILHFIFSLLLSSLFISKSNFLLILLLICAGGFLIDIDHYLIYFIKTKNFNLWKGYKFYLNAKHGRNEHVLQIFHTFEFFALVLISCLFFPMMLYFSASIPLHYILDILENIFTKNKDYVKVWSILYFIIKKKNSQAF